MTENSQRVIRLRMSYGVTSEEKGQSDRDQVFQQRDENIFNVFAILGAC